MAQVDWLSSQVPVMLPKGTCRYQSRALGDHVLLLLWWLPLPYHMRLVPRPFHSLLVGGLLLHWPLQSGWRGQEVANQGPAFQESKLFSGQGRASVWLTG